MVIYSGSGVICYGFLVQCLSHQFLSLSVLDLTVHFDRVCRTKDGRLRLAPRR
jgi:hypothetical protein